LAEVAVVLNRRGDTVNRASIVLGAAAPIPWRAIDAEKALTGKRINPESARAAATAAIRGATPLSENVYKIPMFEAV
jgi:xanthine dehydrogenase YagS FAD-binding subunit